MAHDNVTPNVNSANSTGETFNHEVLTADNTTLTAFVMLFSTSSNAVNTITYNGVAMNSAATPVEYNYQLNRYFNLASYTLDGVSAGVQEFAITFTGTAVANACILVSRTEHNNGVGSTAGSATGNTNNPAVTFTTDAATGTILAAAMVLGADSDPFAPDGSETERADSDTGGGSTTTDFGFTVLELPATGGSDTLGSTASSSNHWAMLAIELDAEVAGGITEDVNQATETDTALAFSKDKSKEAGQSTETNTAQAIASLKERPAGQAPETDTALSLSVAKSKATGLTSETDAALTIASHKLKAIGQAPETDTAQAMNRTKTAVLGQPSTTETAQPVTALKTAVLEQASESDAALPVSVPGGITETVGLTSETDTAQALASAKSRSAGLASETDTALAVVAVKTRPLGMATETNAALGAQAAKARALGLATETDTALGVVWTGLEVAIYTALVYVNMSPAAQALVSPASASAARVNLTSDALVLVSLTPASTARANPTPTEEALIG